MQLKISKRLRSCAAAEAVELLAVNANEIAKIAAPAQDGMENIMQARGDPCGQKPIPTG